MAEEYDGIREEDIDLMHEYDVLLGTTLENLIDRKIIDIAQLGGRYAIELQNLIDYIVYPHSHEEIIVYAMALKHRLEEK